MSKLNKIQLSRFENKDNESNRTYYTTKSVASKNSKSSLSQDNELINKSQFIIDKSEQEKIPQIIRSLNPNKNNNLYNDHTSLSKTANILKSPKKSDSQ